VEHEGIQHNHPKEIPRIYDGKEVSIAENPKLELEESPLLWSDSDALISLARDYFEILWSIGKKHNYPAKHKTWY
jgi:hypothetical protein